jgi:trehalose synthase
LLAHPVDGAGYQIRFLLSHPEIAARLAEQGRQHVAENFLITSNLKHYLTLLLTLANSSKN